MSTGFMERYSTMLFIGEMQIEYRHKYATTWMDKMKRMNNKFGENVSNWDVHELLVGA